MVRSFLLSAAALIVAIDPVVAAAQKVDPGDPDKVADTTPFLTITKGATAGTPLPTFCYYRLHVDPKDEDVGKTIGHIPRNTFGRLIRGVDYSFTSLLKVRAGVYEETVILYSRKFRSSRKEGEAFDRSRLVKATDYPVFLFQRDSNGQASLAVSAEMRRTQTFEIAGAALEAVSLGLKAVSPSADIITTLTSDSAKAVAQKIDQGAGAFMGSTGSNGESYDLALNTGESIHVKVRGPRYEISKANLDAYLLGSWEVSFQPAFASYFNPQVACAAGAETTAWQLRGENRHILSAPLVNNVPQIGTLAAYLKQLDWWTEAQNGIKGKAASDPAVGSFCRRIVDSVSGLGFNTVDAYLVADAVSRSSLVGVAEGTAMRGATACKFEDRAQA